MKDEKLLSIAKRLYELERSSIGSGYPGKVEYAVPSEYLPRRGNAKDAEKKRKALFGSMSETELNELRTILSIVSYKTHNQKGAIRAMMDLRMDDLKAWQKKLGVDVLSRDECLKELDKRSNNGIAQSIEKYLMMRPMETVKRNLVGISLFRAKR